MGGANSKGQEKYLCIELHNAIVDGNENAVRELLLCGAVSPNNKLFMHSRKLVLPLFTAVENNFLTLVEILLQYDASTSTFNREGLTPLHLAVTQNLVEVAETLIRHQADPSAINAQGDTALHTAATYGLINMAALLLRSGVSVNSAGKLQRTPLHSACAIPGNTNMIMALLNNGADPDALDEEHRAPLHYLAQLGNTQGIECLLQAGAQKNTSDLNGKTALHITVENEEIAATRCLIRHQCDINWQDVNGQTPLYLAVEKEYGELVSLLLQNGADANSNTTSGGFPLRAAVWKKNIDIAQKLLLNGAANINACDRTGITALNVACLYALKNNENDKELVEMLINNGADVNARCTKLGRTPLHRAVEAKNDETVATLLRNGADVSIVDSKGKTPADISSSPTITSLLHDSSSVHLGNFVNGGLNYSSNPSRRLDQTPPSTNIRPTNLYTPPTSRSNQQNRIVNPPGNGVINAPPVPPRNASNQTTEATLEQDGATIGLPSLNVVRHNFTWSSLNSSSNSSSHSNHATTKRDFDLSDSSKLLSFPTSFGAGKTRVLCHSIQKSGQLIDTQLGCLVDIAPASVSSNLLLYVEALNYSDELLPLPTSNRLCSNIVHFYTHCMLSSYPRMNGLNGPDSKPEKEVPHFKQSLVVKFPLRRSAIELYDESENDVKILVSYDEGSSWEEAGSRIEKISVENKNSNPETLYLITTETDELGMYAVVLCPLQDVKNISSGGEKMISSVEPSLSLSVDLASEEKCTVDMIAELVSNSTLEKLQNGDFPYVIACSRRLSISFRNRDDSEQTNYLISLHIPCPLPSNTNHSDLSYRILKNCEELNETGWGTISEQDWSDATLNECQQLQLPSKGRRLLGSTQSGSPQNVSFNIILRTSVRTSFLVVAVRTFTATLSNHVVLLPRRIENLQMAMNICVLVHQKTTKLSHVVCDVVSEGNTKSKHKTYRQSGAYLGPRPSIVQAVNERDCLSISAAGGIKLHSGESCRRFVFHSCLLPFCEQFNIKGTSCSYNTTDEHVGYIEVQKETKGAGDKPKLRSALNSESSILVMENNSAMVQSNSATNLTAQPGKTLVASLPLELPRKNKNKTTKPAPAVVVPLDKDSLSDKLLHQICKDLDEPEMKELAFQLEISKQSVDEIFSQHPDNTEQAGVAMLQEWARGQIGQNHDVIPPFCNALRCIGRETLSQDVAKQCNPFVLEELTDLAPLPILLQGGGVELPPENTNDSSAEGARLSDAGGVSSGLFRIPE